MISRVKMELKQDTLTEQQLKILSILKECPIETAVDLAEKLMGVRKKLLYQIALELSDGK